MSKKRLLAVACVILFGILLNVFILTRPYGYAPIDIEVQLEITADHDGIVQLFYGNNGHFDEESSLVFEYKKKNKTQLFTGKVPSNVTSIRLDFPDDCSEVWVSLLRFARYNNEIVLTEDKLANAKMVRTDDVIWNNGTMDVAVAGRDSCVIFADEDFPLHEITDMNGKLIGLRKWLPVFLWIWLCWEFYCFSESLFPFRLSCIKIAS